jgi:hypothetical protein
MFREDGKKERERDKSVDTKKVGAKEKMQKNKNSEKIPLANSYWKRPETQGGQSVAPWN